MCKRTWISNVRIGIEFNLGGISTLHSVKVIGGSINNTKWQGLIFYNVTGEDILLKGTSYIDCGNATVFRNAVALEGSVNCLTKVIICDNKIVNSRYGSLNCNFVKNALVRNNIIKNSTDIGIDFSYGNVACEIYGNIVTVSPKESASLVRIDRINGETYDILLHDNTLLNIGNQYWLESGNLRFQHA
jgi:hypothetical protein